MSLRYQIPPAGTAEAAVPLLFHMVPSRSMIVRWMLEELGAAYEVCVIDREAGEQRSEAYRQNVNPMGKVPALAHQGVVVTETAAICAYLADEFPAAGLAPAVGTPERGLYYRWLFFGPSCIEPAVIDRSLERSPGPKPRMGYGSYEDVFATLAAELAGREYLVGGGFTVADLITAAQLGWGLESGTIDGLPALEGYVARMQERPAYQRARAMDAELMS